jgi:hypothetical protein
MRIERLKRPIGPGQQPHHVDFLDADPFNRDQAELIVQDCMAAFHQHGYNAEQDYWWCRNIGDVETTILVLRAD